MTEPESKPIGSLDVQQLWEKYEDIAMHFNDLLMRLRSQSIAGIAALSTIVGLLTKGDVANLRISWLVAAMIFVAMALVWVAIWCIDFLYYNVLLMGAVTAIKQLEAETMRGGPKWINMSTLIEDQFAEPPDISPFHGVLLFYGIVLGILVAGALFCLNMHWETPVTVIPTPLEVRFFKL
jgi:hypothetical protein